MADVGNLIGNDEEEVGEATAAVSPSSGPFSEDLAYFYVFTTSKPPFPPPP